MPDSKKVQVVSRISLPLTLTLFFSAAADYAVKAILGLTFLRIISDIADNNNTAVLGWALLIFIWVVPQLTPPQLICRITSRYLPRNLVVWTTALQYLLLTLLITCIINFSGNFLLPGLAFVSIILGICAKLAAGAGKILVADSAEEFLSGHTAAVFCACTAGIGSGVLAGYYFMTGADNKITALTVLAAIAVIAVAFRIPPVTPAKNSAPPQLPLYSPSEQNSVRFAAVAEAIAWCGLIFMLLSFMPLTNLETAIEYGAATVPLLLLLGVILGVAAAWVLSGKLVQIGLIAPGLILMTITAISVTAQECFGIETLLAWSILLFGAGCGIVVVPARAYQLRYVTAPQRCRAFAATSIINGFMTLLTLLLLFFSIILTEERHQLPALLTVLLLLSSAWLLWREPRLLTRTVVLLLTIFFYRLRVFGRDNIPASGPALLVANHVSFIDIFLIAACTSRQVRFMMHESFYRYPLFYPFVKWAGIIEVPQSRPRQLRQLMTRTRQILSSGGIVCLFPEGKITRNGIMSGFNKGAAVMLPPGLAVPVIPVRLGMIWGSIFTYYYGKIKLRFPAELPHPASVTIGKPVDPNLTGYQMRLLLSEMAAETELIPAGQELPLHSRFAQLAKHHPLRKMIKEFNGTEQREPRNFSLLVKAVLLSREIRRIVPVEDKYVGIMLPGTAACTVTVLAVMMADKTPAMINFTASREANASAIAQAGLHCILTSKLFLKKANLEPCPQMVYLEDMAAKFTMAVKLFWTAAAALLPWRELMNLVSPESNRDVHRTAVIIFSSGSTGIPKGVMLSHHNINSDLFSLIRIMNWRHSDKIIGNLPAFHGFGFTACLWLPIMYGAEVIYVPNPLDAVVVMQAIKNNQVTILLATPGFLQGYMRKGSATDFKSLRMVVCGAEKLRDDIADKFQNLTGLAIAEGYGCTELSPVVSVNIAGSILDLGTRVGKRGSIGAPMPGICVKIVDPETFVTLPADTDGLMLVKGATVMQGYLNAPEKTAEVIRDGWYITGDIAAMDSRGYITITGRLSRFSKVAGEMVPHELIEKEINQLLQSESRVIAVCGAPDAKKGEKLVVFYSDKTINPDSIVTALRQRQIPNLWIPRAENFIAIDNIPMLGSGKLDLNAIKLLAQKRFSNIP